MPIDHHERGKDADHAGTAPLLENKPLQYIEKQRTVEVADLKSASSCCSNIPTVTLVQCLLPVELVKGEM